MAVIASRRTVSNYKFVDDFRKIENDWQILSNKILEKDCNNNLNFIKKFSTATNPASLVVFSNLHSKYSIMLQKKKLIDETLVSLNNIIADFTVNLSLRKLNIIQDKLDLEATIRLCERLGCYLNSLCLLDSSFVEQTCSLQNEIDEVISFFVEMLAEKISEKLKQS
jgi:hypothetical protein